MVESFRRRMFGREKLSGDDGVAVFRAAAGEVVVFDGAEDFEDAGHEFEVDGLFATFLRMFSGLAVPTRVVAICG